jgi:hypothetical protein
MGVASAVPFTPTDPRPRVPLPGAWRFWADLLRTGEPLGPVQVSGFGFTSRLSGFGNGTGSFTLPCGLDPARLLRLWSWRLWAWYGEDPNPVWCGVPSGIGDEDGSVRVSLTFTELTGYLTKRQFDVHPKWSTPGGGMEQTAIAAMLAAPLADVGVRVVTAAGAPRNRDRTYEYLESEHRGQLLANLAGVDDGPEFRAEYGMTAAGRPECVLRIASPRVGGPTGLGVTIPGTALGFRAQWDADKLRTRTFAVGDLPENAAADAVRPVSVVDRPQPDLPRLDGVDDWPGTFVLSTLAERANTMAGAQSRPALALSASPPANTPPLGSYRVGDDVTIYAETPLLPGGLDATGRLTEVSVSAAEDRATWSVVTSMPPPLARETLAGRLGRLDLTTRTVFQRGPMDGPPPEYPEGA